MVVFRDDKGVKTPVFDSQVHCETSDEGDKVCTIYMYMYIVLRNSRILYYSISKDLHIYTSHDHLIDCLCALG